MKKEKWNPNDWQGRRKDQVEGHAIMAMIGVLGVMLVLLFAAFVLQ
tara:strand:+ start:623 stop:760 length:138 start_codon:yes stop_codon:yes gene_type:complete